MRLDRDRSESNAAWGEARRGDVLDVAPIPDAARARVGKDVLVTPIDPRGD
jgi:hypothetical protein